MASSDRITLTDAEMAAAREWIADCQWVDTELMTASEARDVIATLSVRQVLRIVARNYDGGLDGFAADFGLVGYLGRGL